jgi:Family of unknown function (DUF5343)
MAEEAKAKDETVTTSTGSEPAAEQRERREIKGGLPYAQSPGTFKKSLDLIIQAERPENFSANFMATILKLTGGSAKAIPPLLKKMQFLNPDGSPTGLYSKFKTEGGRSQAAFEGLRNSFSELFKRNEHIYKAQENDVKDVIVEITGLKKSDKIVRLIYSTFDAIRSFVNAETFAEPVSERQETSSATPRIKDSETVSYAKKIGLSYNINIILPETENISVFDAIFRSLRDNLLQ